MKRILSFATYPIKNPQHGGQKRIDAVMNEYAEAGFEARFIAIYHEAFYEDAGQYDIAVTGKAYKEVLASPWTGDVICGKAIFNEEEIKAQVIKQIREFKPDVIDIHQAFPYLGLKKLLKEANLEIPLIFNSHNIEHAMKKEMLEGLSWDTKNIIEVTETIRQCEEELAKRAIITSAVSRGDATKLEHMGAKNVVIAPNGIYEIEKDETSISQWSNRFKGSGVEKIALFVGSAHPPNWFGFREMIGLGLGFLAPSERMVLAGSVSEYVEHEVSKVSLDPAATTFWKRVYYAGRLSQEQLSGLILYSDTIVLPITEGGGSNLKTAEAIISGKKVVATDYAFRGFEELKKLPGIRIANSQDEFVQSITDSLKDDQPKRSDEDQELAKTVLWQNCLSNFIHAVGAL